VSDIRFSSLTDVAVRDAWAHEAHKFTPWLAANLDRLASVIGVPLELTGTEMQVGPFSADILARNPTDDSVVLIENQLESSDHTHLGQIMTYLAGLQAQTMVWVAPTFREEHLSAIRWLNEHTVDPFAFFAVRLRVVRIADSPFAPLFEVIERPNNWDRRVAEKRRETEGDRTETGQFRLDFWTHFCTRYPVYGPAGAASSIWAPLPGTTGYLVQYLAKDRVGVFVRPPRGGSPEALTEDLSPHLAQLADELGTGRPDQLPYAQLSIDTHDRANWDRTAGWLDESTRAYQAAFAKILGAAS
jgi:hypothetical protein